MEEENFSSHSQPDQAETASKIGQAASQYEGQSTEADCPSQSMSPSQLSPPPAIKDLSDIPDLLDLLDLPDLPELDNILPADILSDNLFDLGSIIDTTAPGQTAVSSSNHCNREDGTPELRLVNEEAEFTRLVGDDTLGQASTGLPNEAAEGIESTDVQTPQPMGVRADSGVNLESVSPFLQAIFGANLIDGQMLRDPYPKNIPHQWPRALDDPQFNFSIQNHSGFLSGDPFRSSQLSNSDAATFNTRALAPDNYLSGAGYGLPDDVFPNLMHDTSIGLGYDTTNDAAGVGMARYQSPGTALSFQNIDKNANLANRRQDFEAGFDYENPETAISGYQQIRYGSEDNEDEDDAKDYSIISNRADEIERAVEDQTVDLKDFVDRLPLDVVRKLTPNLCEMRSSRDMFGKKYPPSSRQIPNDLSLENICKSYPNHLQGRVLKRMKDAKWSARKIWGLVTDEAKTEKTRLFPSKDSGQGHSFLQKRLSMLDSRTSLYTKLIERRNRLKRKRKISAVAAGSETGDQEESANKSIRRIRHSSGIIPQRTKSEATDDEAGEYSPAKKRVRRTGKKSGILLQRPRRPLMADGDEDEDYDDLSVGPSMVNQARRTVPAPLDLDSQQNARLRGFDSGVALTAGGIPWSHGLFPVPFDDDDATVHNSLNRLITAARNQAALEIQGSEFEEAVELKIRWLIGHWDSRFVDGYAFHYFLDDDKRPAGELLNEIYQMVKAAQHREIFQIHMPGSHTIYHRRYDKAVLERIARAFDAWTQHLEQAVWDDLSRQNRGPDPQDVVPANAAT